jgi:hypothetical protein
MCAFQNYELAKKKLCVRNQLHKAQKKEEEAETVRFDTY